MVRHLLNINHPSVEESIIESTDIWAKNLKSLFHLAADRFGDVSWECAGLPEKIWGHKAPKTFKERYFRYNALNSSPLGVSSTSQSHHSQPSVSSLYSLYQNQHPSASHTALPALDRESTIRLNLLEDDVLLLDSVDSIELFRAQLEWLYTGEGLGDVVEWISHNGTESIGDELSSFVGRRGDFKQRQDRLSQDLTYMWRSKLYADVRIHLDQPATETSISDDSDHSVDSLSSTAVFASHRFILVSRSPYFASVFLNTSSFSPSSLDVHLPVPPFTPASLHFCLGFMYAGHLDFSHRTFDLSTAFQIHRAATYLQLDSLVSEIEARIVHDFCHGLEWDACRCKKCIARAPRVWSFALADEVCATALEHRAMSYLVRGWKDTWGREVGLVEVKERRRMVESVAEMISPVSITSTLTSIHRIRTRLDLAIRAGTAANDGWVDAVSQMVNDIDSYTSHLILSHFPAVSQSVELWDLVSGNSFSSDLLEDIMDRLVQQCGSPHGVHYAPLVYQALVSSLLMKMETFSIQRGLPVRSEARSIIDSSKSRILQNISRHWMQIKNEDGFHAIDTWAIKEISDGISYEELINSGDIPHASRPISPIRPSSKLMLPAANVVGMPESLARRSKSSTAPSRDISLSESSRSAGDPSSSTGSGLKRLRLGSSVSTTSSVNNLPRPHPRPRDTKTSQGITRLNRLTSSDAVPCDSQLHFPTAHPVSPAASTVNISKLADSPRINRSSPVRTLVDNQISSASTSAKPHSRTATPTASSPSNSAAAARSSTRSPNYNVRVQNSVSQSLLPKARPTPSASNLPESSSGSESLRSSSLRSRSLVNSKLSDVSIDQREERQIYDPSYSSSISRDGITNRVQSSAISRIPSVSSSVSGGTQGITSRTIRTANAKPNIRLHKLETRLYPEVLPRAAAQQRSVHAAQRSLKKALPLMQAQRPVPSDTAYGAADAFSTISGSKTSCDDVPWDGPGLILNIGIPCISSLAGSRTRFKASIRYIGHMHNSQGPFIGIEIPAVSQLGLATLPSGAKGGVSYFSLSPPVTGAAGQTSSTTRVKRLVGSQIASATYAGHTVDLKEKEPSAVWSRPGCSADRPSKETKHDVGVLFIRPSEVVFILSSE
ncbi:uncharacterized protein IL334_001993 [Kwoniella shivajii]|uniref:BTB domain-containing protein n=1 Tax=Kwoniella shivajii TaxID=564305 RepID=A0ABZ1CTH4_9TREE|nr:hypothetical protein IL334_001993 [Kwoniella shivajii]